MVSQRASTATELLRGVWAAVSSHRLYPGDLDRPAFRRAAERVRSAANALTAADPLHVEVRRDRLVVAGEELPVADPGLGALASACFARRVEQLVILRPPEPRELAAVAEILSQRADDLEAAGGIGALLVRHGVRSIDLGSLAPDAELQGAASSLDPGTRELWELVSDPERFVSNLLVQGLPSDVAESAHRIHRQLAAVHSGLPAEVVGRGALFAHVGRILSLLPPTVRDELLSISITQVEHDQFSAELLHNLTDPQLAEWLVELSAAGGPDPGVLAERVAAATGRRSSLLGIVEAERALAGGTATEPASMAGVTRQRDRDAAATAVADALGRRLLDQRSPDLVAVLAAFPASPVGARAVAIAALRDYLTAEDDTERIEAVLGNWAEAVRASVSGGDLQDLETLLDTVAGPLAAATPDKQIALRRGVANVLDHGLLEELLTLGRAGGDGTQLRSLVRFLGGVGIDELLDALATEDDPGLRAQLVTLLGEVASGHVERIAARLSDPRWFVARNVVTILGRSGNPAGLPVLVSQLEHPEPGVRREVVRALVALGGPEVVRWLRRLARDRDADVRAAALDGLAVLTTDEAAAALAELVTAAEAADERRLALDRLTTHLAPSTGRLLDELARRGAGPRLSRALRKVARDAARRRQARG